MNRCETVIVKIENVPLSEDVLSQTINVLNLGGLVAYPTETVYGLGCDAFNGTAVRRIIDLKGRGGEKGLLVLVHSIESVGRVAKIISTQAELLMKTFWPGPLTLIFEALPELPDILTGGKGRLGVRVSPDPVCRSILDRYRGPLVSTSANPSGERPARNAREVLDAFGGRVDLILDHGNRSSALPSTVLDVSGPVPALVRKGPIPSEAIQETIGEIIEKDAL